MTSGISRLRMRSGLFVMIILMAFQLAACGDKEATQRKAFIEFLQNTVLRSGENLPRLSENQKQNFGPYAADYAVIYSFSQQVNNAVSQGMKPVVETLNAIRVPQDYLLQRERLRQTSGNLGVLTQQIQSAKTRADNSKKELKQPDELKSVYNNVYKNVVEQPAGRLIPLLPGLQVLSQSVVQVGDYLQSQGSRVSFDNGAVQFPTAEQATQYNTLIADISANAEALNSAQKMLQGN